MNKSRRLITRLAMLFNILTLRRISSGFPKRFPTYEHFIDTGLMTDKEMKKPEKLDQKASTQPPGTPYSGHRRFLGRQGMKDQYLQTFCMKSCRAIFRISVPRMEPY